MGWDVLVLVLYVDQFPGGSGSHDNSIRVCWCWRCVCPVVVIHSKCSELTLVSWKKCLEGMQRG